MNQLTQKAALEALKNQQQQAEWVTTILKGRVELAARLKAFSFVKKIHPSAANFLLVEVEQPKDLYQFLVDHGIIARDRSSVPLCEGCLRLTVGRPEENQLLLSVLQAYQA